MKKEKLTGRERAYLKTIFTEMVVGELEAFSSLEEGILEEPVRVHLLPPYSRTKEAIPVVVALNGCKALPISFEAAVLLREYLCEMGQAGAQNMTLDEREELMTRIVQRAGAVYPKKDSARLRDNLERLLKKLEATAKEEQQEEELAAVVPLLRAPLQMELMVYAGDGRQGLSTGQWKRIIDRCRWAGIPKLVFAGEEPTKRNDLNDLIAYASWAVTRLETNGELLDETLSNRLMEAGLDELQIDPAFGKAGGLAEHHPACVSLTILPGGDVIPGRYVDTKSLGNLLRVQHWDDIWYEYLLRQKQ